MDFNNYNIEQIYSNNIWYRTSIRSDRYKRFIGWQNGIYNPKPTLVSRNKVYEKSDVFSKKLGLENHLAVYRKHKEIYNISLYGKDDNVDTTVFYDEYKGRRRLNISAHGALNEEYFGDKGSRIIIGGEYFDADRLAGVAQQFHDYSPFDCVRVIACYSGDGGDASLISNLSSALKLPVKGYEGKVVGLNFATVSKYKKQYGTKATEDMLIEHQALGRASDVNEVVKGSGQYVRRGRTVMAGMEFF